MPLSSAPVEAEFVRVAFAGRDPAVEAHAEFLGLDLEPADLEAIVLRVELQADTRNPVSRFAPSYVDILDARVVELHRDRHDESGQLDRRLPRRGRFRVGGQIDSQRCDPQPGDFEFQGQ